jgi:hypothetical protein
MDRRTLLPALIEWLLVEHKIPYLLDAQETQLERMVSRGATAREIRALIQSWWPAPVGLTVEELESRLEILSDET